MHYVFPDTNIFIHGKDFESIDWAGWLRASEITLVIPPVVISELDKHKYNPNRRVSRRARALMPRLEAIFENSSLGKLRVKVLLNKPGADTFAKHSLDVKEQDDSLLASIIEFKATIKSGDTLVLITNDTGPRLKARSFEIPTLKLPDELIQPEEQEESEKQIKALEKELLAMKNKVPVLSVNFPNEGKFITIKRAPELISKKEYVEKEMVKIRHNHPQLVFQDSDQLMDFGGKSISFPSPLKLTKEQVNKYNIELEKFFKEYEKLLESKYQKAIYLTNVVMLSLIVPNSGYVPAEDVDIHFHFPDGFEMVTKRDFPKVLREPTPPYKPKHALDIALSNFAAPILPNIGGNINPEVLAKLNSNVSSPDIKKTNSYDVRFHVKVIKHNQNVELDTLYLKFRDINAAKGFSLDYKIYAANIPKMIEGALHVNFTSDD